MVFGSRGAETLCGMVHEARVSISEHVVYSHKETGLNYSGGTGRACQKPETFVCSEALNLPGGAALRPMVDPRRHLPLGLHSRFENEYETLE